MHGWDWDVLFGLRSTCLTDLSFSAALFESVFDRRYFSICLVKQKSTQTKTTTTTATQVQTKHVNPRDRPWDHHWFEAIGPLIVNKDVVAEGWFVSILDVVRRFLTLKADVVEIFVETKTASAWLFIFTKMFLVF